MIPKKNFPGFLKERPFRFCNVTENVVFPLPPAYLIFSPPTSF